MDYKKEIEKIEKLNEEKKVEKTRLEERKRQLLDEKAKLLKQLAEYNIKESELTDVIEELEIELEQGIKECQNCLN